MVGVEDRNEDVAEEEAPGPSSVPELSQKTPDKLDLSSSFSGKAASKQTNKALQFF